MTQIKDPLLRYILRSPLNQVNFRLDDENSMGELVKRCADIINIAGKEICILTDNSTPDIVSRLKDTLLDKADDLMDFPRDNGPKPITVVARKKDKNEDAFLKALSGKETVYFRSYDGKKLAELEQMQKLTPSMKNDYFLIADNHVFWAKPAFNEGCFTYNAPVLAEKLKKEITRSFPQPASA